MFIARTITQRTQPGQRQTVGELREANMLEGSTPTAHTGGSMHLSASTTHGCRAPES
jgi:hypothetical protein